MASRGQSAGSSRRALTGGAGGSVAGTLVGAAGGRGGVAGTESGGPGMRSGWRQCGQAAAVPPEDSEAAITFLQRGQANFSTKAPQRYGLPGVEARSYETPISTRMQREKLRDLARVVRPC